MAFVLKSSNNSVPAIFSNSSAFGQTVNIQLSGADNDTNFICMHEAQLRLRLQGAPVGAPIKKPVIAWITVYDITLNFTDGVVKRFATQAQRGLVGNILQLSSNSYSNTEDNMGNNLIDISATGTSPQTSDYEYSIDLKYLVDAFMTRKYLSIKNMTMNVTFDTVSNIYDGSSTELEKVKLSGIFLDFQTYKLDLAKTESSLLHYTITTIYVAGGFISKGSDSFTQTLSIPGALRCLFYCFIPADSSKKMEYNAWNTSVVRNHSLQSMTNKLYPTNPNYDTIAGSKTIGLNRHYNEYKSNINKLCPNSDTWVTYDKYSLQHRFYSIGTYNHKMTSGSYTLQIQQTVGAPEELKILIFGLYIPTEHYNTGDYSRM